MASETSVSELAKFIQEKTQLVENGGQPGDDFSLAFHGKPAMLQLTPELETARSEAIEAMDELRARLLQPFAYTASVFLPVCPVSVICHSLYTFDIASHVPLVPGQAITYEELAKKCDMPFDDLRRVVQTAISYRIFEEVEADVSVKHNAVSAMFAALPGARDILGLFAEEQMLGAGGFIESIQRFPGSGEPGHASAMIVERNKRGLSNDSIEDPSKGLFDLVADDAPRVTRYRNAMGMGTRAPGYAASYFLDTVPWSDAKSCPKTIVDVGGAGGDFVKQILKRFPNVEKATVLDLPEVIATAETPKELEGRLEFSAYNFITQPMSHDADAYVLRHIFHDWSDDYAVKIVKNMVPKMKNGSRIWISEVVVPDLGDKSHVTDQRRRGADILMKIAYNGKERSRRGWTDVFERADKRFRINSIVQPEGAQDAVVEVVFEA
ncbi:S-adenosyl-L-methionine-dependent methyltransferase [Xylariaceae sp. FL1272]|nr:S-adenosyl-L-methionine-dependent methyltransferase [Xylariaceae sp. FL1272]